ncbi:multicopper oxidase domain-containing protein [Isoptericola rhizosphaerae]|uniref:multicopper oxidase domain-containing protein n=1 Tax=Isoptericola rhizosphaerae TaxID=3377837 RepID=UPI00383ABC91
MTRRAWYLLMNSFVGLWAVAAVLVISVHRFFPAGGWLMVHLVLLGTVSAAILVWSQHFADAILRRPAPGGRVSHGARLVGHTLGAALVVTGIVADTWTLVLFGGVVLAVVALAHVALVTLQARRALPARFARLVHYYIAAALALVIGVGAGVLLARVDLPPGWYDRIYPAHLAFNLLGWIGFTVVGTIVLLWPTVLRTRITDTAERTARRSLWLLVVGLLVVAAACVADTGPLVALGVLVYLAGLVLVVVEGAKQARQARPTSFAALSIAAAVAWFAGCTVAFGVILSTADTAADAAVALSGLVAPFAGGFAAQIVVGALSYLLPVVIGGGPRTSRHTIAELDRAAVFRVTVVNAGGVLYVLPVPSLVRVLVSLVVFTVFVSFLWLVARALLAVRRAPQRAPHRAGTAGSLAAAAAVLVLSATGGIALDPAAAGIGGTTASASASGETTTVDVVMDDMRFEPAVIEVPVGNRLVVNLTNGDTMDHDLTIANGVRGDRLSPGESTVVDAGVVAGDLDAWCSVAGHRLLGMTLDIIAVGAPPGEEHDRGGSGAHSSDAPPHPVSGATPGPEFEAADAALSPAAAATVHEHTFVVSDLERDVAPDTSQSSWTFSDTVPGPTLRGKVGDTFEITLVNDGTIGHSIDFHAGALAPDEPMRTIAPGESLTYTFTATRAGIWMYHCATAPMSLHIAAGMFGAVIIDPPGLPDIDREYLLVQSEHYLGAHGGEPDTTAIASQHPDLVVFNGYADQYMFAPLEARVGERVRVWVLDAGPNRPSSFHVIGGQFDTVYLEGDYLLHDGGSTGAGGSQALALQPAQGGFVELVFAEAGNYPFVTHILSDAEKGASGLFAVKE